MVGIMKRFIADRYKTLPTETLEVLEADAPLPKIAIYGGAIFAGIAAKHGIDMFHGLEYGQATVATIGVACGLGAAALGHTFESVIHEELEQRRATEPPVEE